MKNRFPRWLRILLVCVIIGVGIVIYAVTANRGSDTVNIEGTHDFSSFNGEDLANHESSDSNNQDDSTATPQPTTSQQEGLWPMTYNNDESSSITLVVNKKYRLPDSYAPAVVAFEGGSLRSVAAEYAQKLFDAAQSAGMQPKLVSGYRSYSAQERVYSGYVEQDGREQADTYSARPGHSEHQTGLAMDVGNANGECELETCFGSTAFGKWLEQHAAEYGFIIRYPSGKESVTGYQYEPWHLRFVGTDTALSIASSGKTMDEYYGVEAGNYAD